MTYLLIIDENINKQRQLRTVLCALGYKTSDIEAVENTNLGRNLIRKRRYSCCFVALTSTTFNFVKELRALPSTQTLPIIVYGQATRQNAIAAAETGVTAYLVYPFTANDVEMVLRENSIIKFP